MEALFQAAKDRAKQFNEKNRQKKTAKGALDIAGRDKGLFGDAMNVFNEVKTPLQTFQEKMKKIKAMADAGAISWETYAKAAAGAVAELEKAHRLAELQAPESLTKDSSAAKSAEIRGMNLDTLRNKESPEERIARILKEAKEIEAKQLEQQKKIAAALEAQANEQPMGM
jgi:hypothetical protein